MQVVEPSSNVAKAASKVRLARQATDKFLLDVAATLAPGDTFTETISLSTRAHFAQVSISTSRLPK